MKRLLSCGALALLTGLAPAACSLRRATHTVPLPLAATHALAEARQLVRLRPEGWQARAVDAARAAADAAPDWVAPQRVLDDLLREDLLGHEALAARKADLDPSATAAELYLAGRLEGRAGLEHIERAARLDPALAWAQHGVAWLRFLGGDARLALRAGRRAVELARGSYELGTFATAEARYLLELGRIEDAIEHLSAVLDDARLAEPERTELEAVLARAELESDEREVVERGFWRVVALLERDLLRDEEYEELGEHALARRSLAGQPDALAVLLAALEDGRGEARERLRARVLAERGAYVLAAEQWERAGGSASSGLFQRTSDLGRGAAQRAVERWLAALPARLKDSDGEPREPALRAVVRAARAAGEPGGAPAFGRALIDAGWFPEAESWAEHLAELDPQAALELLGRAAAGQALLGGVRSVLEHVDERRAAFAPALEGRLGQAREIDGLDELLVTLQDFFERYRGEALSHDLVDSPRLSFGGVASIVHPGPRFSALDALEGRGEEGAPVPGLAAELARIGRFGIVGEAPGGGGPDGTVLRLVGGEWRAGAHLGVSYSGWVAWCEGADVESRPGRNGSSVSGAALHEGYWIDLEGVRRDWERLRALERRFLDAPSPALERALEGRGPRLPPGSNTGERARWLTPLGEGERVLLAALRERAPHEGGRVAFDELLDLTALHEEGHLTDRTRFLPLALRWPRALSFLFRHGFSPRAVARALEYRAQLVALCVAAEPRLALADCLTSADSEGGALPHGEAYRALVTDLLRLADSELDAWPALDREHYLLYQLHLLSSEDVRRLARELAAEHGMLEEQ